MCLVVFSLGPPNTYNIALEGRAGFANLLLAPKKICEIEKSYIQGTLNLSTCADSSTDTKKIPKNSLGGEGEGHSIYWAYIHWASWGKASMLQ